MKFKVFRKDRAEKERTVFFDLVEQRGGGVDLVVVDETGKQLYCPYVASITSEGRLRVYVGVNELSGLKLDRSGRVVIERE